MSNDFKWSEVSDKQRWSVAWGVIWRGALLYLGAIMLLLVLTYGVN